MKNLFYLLAFVSVLFSCSKEELNTEATNQQIENELETVSYSYQGTLYDMDLNQEGQFIENATNQEILEAINTGEILKMSTSDTYFVFDTKEEMNTYVQSITGKSIEPTENNIAKSSLEAILYCYNDSQYRGKQWDARNTISVSNLRSRNDEFSSAKAINLSSKLWIVEFYSDSSFRGSRMTLLVFGNTTESVGNFGRHGLNDAISSIKAYFN